MLRQNAKAGFTLVELVLAMALASFVLLALGAIVIQLFHLYQAGSQIRATQQGARTALEEMTRTARESAFAKVDTSGNDAYGFHHDRICYYGTPNAGGISQATIYDASVKEGEVYRLYTQHVDALSPAAPCPATDSTQRVAVTSNDISFYEFLADPINSKLVHMKLRVASSAALDQISPNLSLPYCLEGSASQYCSITNVSSSATLRSPETAL